MQQVGPIEITIYLVFIWIERIWWISKNNEKLL